MVFGIWFWFELKSDFETEKNSEKQRDNRREFIGGNILKIGQS
jgi:hypothetical protein